MQALFAVTEKKSISEQAVCTCVFLDSQKIESMNSESNRLATYSNWPASAPVDPTRLARAGFFYSGEGTEVQCFSCNAKISQWNYGDQVMWRHRLVEPHCTFVEHPSLSGNITLEAGVECESPEEGRWSNIEESQSEPDSATRDYGLTEEDEIYKSDALRLLSFINWGDASLSPATLVQAGFYHAGGGRLRCAWCGGELAAYCNLGALGTPLEIHRMYFPRCDHAATVMAAIQSSNASMSSSPSDTPPVRSPVPNDNAPQSSGAAHNARVLQEGNTWRALGVVSGGARHPNYSSLTARVASFDGWPPGRTQTPQSLAEAGFFHTGAGDQVRCFYCDGGLGKWEAGDAPWEEHAKWFANCGYVLLVKGQEYVDTYRHRPSRRTNAHSSNDNNGQVANQSPYCGRTLNAQEIEAQANECLESPVGLAALAAGLDISRVKNAIMKRLKNNGTVFNTSEALIDAALDEQLGEEPWAEGTNSQRLVRDIISQALGDYMPIPPLPTSRLRRPPIGHAGSSTAENTESEQPRTPSPDPAAGQPSASHERSASHSRANRRNRSNSRNRSPARERSLSQSRSSRQNKTTQNVPHTTQNTPQHTKRDSDSERYTGEKEIMLEEENRQLKESRLCKVCMDSEVTVVFLPCGHLVSCAKCGAALSACPLCRAPVKALVRAYLA